MDKLRVNSVTCVFSLPPLSTFSPSCFLYRSSDSSFVSWYSSAASLSSRSSVAFFSSASLFVYASSFTPLLPLSLFILFLIVLGRRFFLLHQELRLLLLPLPPPPPPSFPPLPPGFPPLYSSLSFATSSFSSSFPLSLSASWGPYLSLLTLVSSVFSAPVFLFPLPLLSTLLFSRFLFFGLHFLSGSCIDYFGSIFVSCVGIIRLLVRISSLSLLFLFLRLLLLRIFLLAPLFFSLPSGPPPLFFLAVRLLLWLLPLLLPPPLLLFCLPRLPLLWLLLLLLLLLLPLGFAVAPVALVSSAPLLPSFSLGSASLVAPSLPFAVQSLTYFLLCLLVSCCFCWPFRCFSSSSAPAPPSGVPPLPLPRLASSFSFLPLALPCSCSAWSCGPGG